MVRVSSKSERVRSLARVQAIPWLLFILLLALTAWLAWRAFGPRDLGDPLAASMAAFEKQNRLTVFTAQLSPVVTSSDERLLGLLESSQVAVIPARVDYTLDLSEMDHSRLTWNEQGQQLDVRLPPLTISRPNLDEGRAQYLNRGMWIDRKTQTNLTRASTQTAEREAAKQAANPVLLNLARAAAKQAIRQNLAIPLEVAGYDRVTVSVRFDGEAAASANAAE